MNILSEFHEEWTKSINKTYKKEQKKNNWGWNKNKKEREKESLDDKKLIYKFHPTPSADSGKQRKDKKDIGERRQRKKRKG